MWQSRTIYATLVDDIMRHISVKLYIEFGQVVQISFKDIPYLELWWTSCSAERNHLGNFGKGQYEEHFCYIILNLDQWFKKCHFKIFLIYISGGHVI